VDINKKIENVIKLPPEERYDYFLRKVADFEQVWGLYSEGWAILKDGQGKKVMPFWPEEEFAQICAKDTWQGYAPKSIELYDFIEKWLTGMYDDDIKVGVFYVPEGKGVTRYPHELKEDLEEELEQYE